MELIDGRHEKEMKTFRIKPGFPAKIISSICVLVRGSGKKVGGGKKVQNGAISTVH